MRARLFLVASLILATSLLTSCAADTKGATLRVPADFAHIQDAVDAAKPGDLILIDSGIYKEAVTVTTNSIVIRGVDRNTVVLDGEYTRANGIRVAGANGVAIENMTAQNYLVNGFYWTGVTGYRASYLTAVRNGYYGVYAFDSSSGLIEHSHARGSYDAGFYIGQCDPCDATVNDVVSEINGLGFSGTNASTNLVITNSIFRFNRVGIMPNSGDYEELSPQHDAVIAGNSIYNNNNVKAPAFASIAQATGMGIVIAGGENNQVYRNRIWGHDVAGIAVTPNVMGKSFRPIGNRVQENVVSESGRADLALAPGEAGSNCFTANSFKSSQPASLELFRPCTGTATVTTEKNSFPLKDILKQILPQSPHPNTVPDAPKQQNMPNANNLAREPATKLSSIFTLSNVSVPQRQS